jgi:hypothetical protein
MAEFENLMMSDIRHPYVVLIVHLQAMGSAKHAISPGSHDFSSATFKAHNGHVATVENEYMVVRINIYTRDLPKGKSLRKLGPAMDNLVRASEIG